MFLRTILGGVLALPFLMAGHAFALGPAAAPSTGFAKMNSGHVVLAQAGDPRVSGLEEQVRALNGRVEELNFQILQMQDQLRRMQEDNEFRFQELEKNGGSGGAPTGGLSDQRTERLPPPGSPADNLSSESQSASRDAPTVGEPPRSLGSVRFDANGNIVGGEVGEPIDLTRSGEIGPIGQGEQIASLPSADDPEELYRNSYEFILAGDYKTAEAGFRQHIDRFPGDARTSDAHFWLGESLLGQDRYRDAAEIFLRASREYPNADKAPDMLLKLGISLAAMNQRDVACVTYNEIGQKYPDVSTALRERVKQEQALAGC
ncbi:tol-pal system protein YbgF [Nitratireductor kimnyeongensis]|uniref:Cell division coordinator CpoB n=1 Tax=Nitratireductor kimnyeongensis TaxID=430679 RepID=A0ABW0TD90_9HYPH|nr:tol-pal system protein YbgF [Nitratireductor kimnyeongensis]QZZ37047.1 tol-pal system protein YbgF [Nitratireductor kimnyeongensis]